MLNPESLNGKRRVNKISTQAENVREEEITIISA